MLDLDAPSLVVDKVEVERIQFVAGHFRHKLLQVLEGDECAARVDHQFADVRARSVGDGELGDGFAAESFCVSAQQLFEGHQSVEHTSS